MLKHRPLPKKKKRKIQTMNVKFLEVLMEIKEGIESEIKYLETKLKSKI
jgi:hypothetical protein